MPKETLHDLEENNIKFKETNNLKDVIDDVDVLYVTRIQKERFPDEEEYEQIKGAYQINKELLEGKDLIVMHPLPRIDEIAYDVDDTKYNKYFEQAANAIPVIIYFFADSNIFNIELIVIISIIPKSSNFSQVFT